MVGFLLLRMFICYEVAFVPEYVVDQPSQRTYEKLLLKSNCQRAYQEI
jgi:hypothetical protein